MLIHIDGLQDADGVVFPLVPTGTHKFRISSVVTRETKSSAKYPGSPLLEIKALICAGEEHAGMNVMFFLMAPTAEMPDDLQKACVNRIKKLCIACDLDANDDLDTDDLMGKELLLIVTEKDGKNNVTDQLPID